MSKIAKIGVVGAGNMGSGIAQKIAQEGIDVTMVDIKDDFLKRGMDTIRSLLHEGVERKIFKPEQVDEILSRITTSTDLAALADADIVIEAVFEDKQVKSDVFKRLDAICSENTILATNTSSFYVREFAEQTSRPDRFIGYHYFYHPAKNRLLEVIPHAATSNETLEKALTAAKLHGKTPIVVKDAAGFAVNRFFVPFLNEAARMYEENMANIATIEEGGKKAFSIGMGPFQLMNVTGIPIAVHACNTLEKELGTFYATADILKKQMEKNENWDISGEVDENRLPDVIDRFLGVCLGVAAQLVDENVATIEDTDRGAKIGLRWRRGPFEIMNRLGIEKTYELVRDIADKYPDFEVPKILIQQKEKGKPFTFRFVDLYVKDGIAHIVLNRPEAMNALNETMFNQIEDHFETALKNPEVKAIVFEGAGKAFIAGADIRYFVEKIKKDRIEDIVTFTRKGHMLLLRIENCEKPTIAVLDGLSLGGGSELALACQAVVATSAGSLGFPETSIGIFPGLGGMLRLARYTSPELSKYYTFTGAPLKSDDAFELGIVDRLVEPYEIESAVKELVSQGLGKKYEDRKIPDSFQPLEKICSGENVDRLLSGKPPEGINEYLAEATVKTVRKKAPRALVIANEIIDAQKNESMEDAVEIELNRLKEIFSTQDALEGLTSLGGKKPEFKGK